MKFNRRWLPLNALRNFEATGKNLSFTLAAEELGVTQSAVSRQVQRLEELLGVTLIERKPREVLLTESGRMLYSKITESFDLLERSLKTVVEGDDRVLLRVSIATSFAHCFGPPMVSGFTQSYPSVQLELDSPGDVTDISSTDYDLAIIFSKPKVTNNVMDLLWMERVTPLCSPDFFDCQDMEINDFYRAMKEKTLLHAKTEAGRYYAWETWARMAGYAEFNTHTGLTFDAAILAVRYAIEGQGIVMADKRLFSREIEEGQLCAPFEELECETGFGYYMTFRQDDLPNEHLQLLRNWLLERFHIE